MPTPEGRGGELEQLLAKEARLEWMIELARLRNPALRASRAEVRAATARTSAASGFPDLELKYEQWGVPLSRPYALNRADTVMLGLRQAIPAPGSVAARERVASTEAAIVADEERSLERELLLRLRTAYAVYRESEQILQVHVEHVGVVEQMVAQLRADYETGRGTQQDLLQMVVELSRLHNDLAETRQRRESSRLLLNALTARDPTAPLGSPPAMRERARGIDVEDLAKRVDQQRPEVAVARHQIERSEQAVELARHTAQRPAFMVGADYWYMPMADTQHAYGAMLSMTVPWLNPRHRANLRATEQSVAVERHKLDAITQKARYELHVAAAGLAAASESLRIIEDELLPQVERSLEAARALFGVGRGNLFSILDTLRSYFEVRIQHARAQARMSTALAEVELAAGAPPRATGQGGTEP